MLNGGIYTTVFFVLGCMVEFYFAPIGAEALS